MTRVPALMLLFHVGEQAVRDLVSATLVEFDMAAVHEHTDAEWRVFFRSVEERDRAAAALSPLAEVRRIDVEADDWARRSQQELRAIAVDRLIIAPPWDIPVARERRTGTAAVIVIEPSTGFGTGHHATTRLCLRALQRLDVRGKRVLDLGTGSGVLAIAAAMLGAQEVVGVDNDADALAAARRNVARNGVPVALLSGDIHDASVEPADILLANLTGAMLQRSATRLAALAPAGTVIVSGFLEQELDDVRAAFTACASHAYDDREDGWGALTFTILSSHPARLVL